MKNSKGTDPNTNKRKFNEKKRKLMSGKRNKNKYRMENVTKKKIKMNCKNFFFPELELLTVERTPLQDCANKKKKKLRNAGVPRSEKNCKHYRKSRQL